MNTSEMLYNQQIGLRIKESRLMRKMTLKTLGSKVGLSESTAKRYEDGQIKSVSIDVIKKFAIALEVSPAYLMGWDTSSLSDLEKDLLKKYRALSPAGKATVDAVINVQYANLQKE